MATTPTIDGWAVLELMGHRRMAGKLTEVLVGGTTLLRIDVPREDGSLRTQLYGVGSVYCITPTTEEIARQVALSVGWEPIHPWELRPRLPAGPTSVADEDEAEFEAHVFKGTGDGHDDPTCVTCGKGPRDEGHISQDEADELESDVHPFERDPDSLRACLECGEAADDPYHAHAFLQAEVGAEDACAVGCGAGPDDQVHVVDEHPYEPEADSGDPCGHCGRYGSDSIHTKTNPKTDSHVYVEAGESEECIHCGDELDDPKHVDVGGGS